MNKDLIVLPLRDKPDALRFVASPNPEDISVTQQLADRSALAQKVVTFPDAIPGFPDARRFVLRDLDEHGTFQLLESVDTPDLSLVVCVPWMFFPDYAPEIDEEVQRQLALERVEDAIVFCSVTAEPDQDELYLNLLGPFVVNVATQQGRQVVQADVDLPARAPVPLAA